jgi:hypothetical protein
LIEALVSYRLALIAALMFFMTMAAKWPPLSWRNGNDPMMLWKVIQGQWKYFARMVGC